LLYNLLPTSPKKYYFLAVDESTSNKHLHLHMHKDKQLSNAHACAEAHTGRVKMKNQLGCIKIETDYTRPDQTSLTGTLKTDLNAGYPPADVMARHNQACLVLSGV